jgi:hypothetical protein
LEGEYIGSTGAGPQARSSQDERGLFATLDALFFQWAIHA